MVGHDNQTFLNLQEYMICIGYTMGKCGVCAHITNEFVVIPEAKPREITINELVI